MLFLHWFACPVPMFFAIWYLSIPSLFEESALATYQLSWFILPGNVFLHYQPVLFLSALPNPWKPMPQNKTKVKPKLWETKKDSKEQKPWDEKPRTQNIKTWDREHRTGKQTTRYSLKHSWTAGTNKRKKCRQTTNKERKAQGLNTQ